MASLLCILLLATQSAATVIRVDQTGGGDYVALSGGVGAAVAGDTVLVAPGRYAGALNREIEASGITIVSESGPDVTIIDCEGKGFAFKLYWVDLSGFTILNGAGIPWSENASVFLRGGTVSDCIFKDGSNTGLLTISRTHTVSDCVFLDHGSTSARAIMGETLFLRCTFSNTRGSGLGFFNPEFRGTFVGNTLRDCVFRGNGGTPLWFHYNGAVIQRCLFDDNPAPAISLYIGGMDIRCCTFVRNHSSSNGVLSFGKGVHPYEFSVAEVVHSIFAYNECNGLISGSPSDYTFFEDNCFFENAGGNDLPDNVSVTASIFEDPLFCDVQAGDFTLCENSPGLLENEPIGVNMGAFPYEPGCGPCQAVVEYMSWGAIKSLYR